MVYILQKKMELNKALLHQWYTTEFGGRPELCCFLKIRTEADCNHRDCGFRRNQASSEKPQPLPPYLTRRIQRDKSPELQIHKNFFARVHDNQA